MTLFKPTLMVKRLVVYGEGERIAYDETFHGGINIIRGENAHGKSTILNLLIHGLGAERVTFNNTSLSCRYTYVEVLINNVPLTLRREITIQSQRPMFIYWGEYKEAATAPIEKWELYPYRGTNKKESFSQVLFKALGLPEIKTDLSSKLTIYQLLRIICKDQMAPVNAIFKAENFDSGDLREEIGGLLCGYGDDRLYEIRLELRRLRDEKKDLSQTLRRINSILSEAGEIPDVQKINKKIKRASKERDRLHSKLLELQKKKRSPRKAGDKKIKQTEKICDSLEKKNNEIKELVAKRKGLVFEERDSEDFMRYLRGNLGSIEQSDVTRTNLGLIDFETCPACYCVIDNKAGDLCPLCGSKVDDASQSRNILRIRQELSYQIAESEKLQENRKVDIEKCEFMLHQLKEEQRRLQMLLEEAVLPTSGQDSEANELCQRIGSLGNEIENLEKINLLAEKLEEIQQSVSELAERISYYEEEEQKTEQGIEKRKESAQKVVSKVVLSLLKKDIDGEGEPYEKEKFAVATDVRFSFHDDRISIFVEGEDGIEERFNFAASSHVILKNSLHFALLAASCEMKSFRFPRFLIIDSIEDKGMEDNRSHCFQKNIVGISGSLGVDHQVIFSTAKIAPELERDQYTIGDYYKGELKSLRLT